ncbi:MAG: choline dehydrogenase, partial [Pseudomonadota bacterium]
PTVSVCLIEAGKKDNSILITMPAGVGKLLTDNKDYNWLFETAPQKHMNNRRLFWPRGKGWGGSSSINGMIYIRGDASDYDQWRQMGLSGWAYEDVLPYFRRSEHYEEGGGDFHGQGGPLWVSKAPLDNPVATAFVEAGRQAGYPLNDDFNGAEQEGVGPYQRTIRNGERASASYSYLHPVMDTRDNLSIISTGLVTKILFDGTTATGVEVVKGRGKQPETIEAAREVIVCCGATQSPQLLELSGIGNSELLKQHGIETVLHQPEIGENLQDHLDVTIIHGMDQPLSAYSQQKGLKKYGVALNYMFRRKGPGRENFLQAGGFIKSREGLDRPDLQLHQVIAIVKDHGKTTVEEDGWTIHACQLRPESRGTTHIGSADPFDWPVIDPNYLAAEEDRLVMRRAVKLTREIAGQNALDVYRGREIMPGQSVQTDEEIDEFVRNFGETIYHPVGTVRMGADPESPLDGECRVRGIEGLRVIDASVMPTLIGGNTNAPTIMIAEKLSDIILGKTPLPRANREEVAA